MPTTLLLTLSVFLFGIGLAVVLTKQHAIFVLIGIELMLYAANLNLVVCNHYYPARLQGQILVLLSVVIVVCETAVALAIILQVYQHYRTITLEKLKRPQRGIQDKFVLQATH